MQSTAQDYDYDDKRAHRVAGESAQNSCDTAPWVFYLIKSWSTPAASEAEDNLIIFVCFFSQEHSGVIIQYFSKYEAGFYTPPNLSEGYISSIYYKLNDFPTTVTVTIGKWLMRLSDTTFPIK